MSVQEDILTLDFAALRTLRLVHRLGSFTAAAESIDVKQSTVSYTIDRIRKALNDPLFVRQGGSIAPTSLCREILPTVERILAEAENLEGGGDFDPSQTHAEVTMVCTSVMMRVLVPRVIRRLRRDAPGLRLNVVIGYGDVGQLLLEGNADIALSASPVETNGIYSDRLLDDSDICLMDPSNPLAGKPLTLEGLANARHLLTVPWLNWKQPHVRELEKRGIIIQSSVVSTSSGELGDTIIGTDLLGALPSRAAREWEGRLAFARFPFATDIHFRIYWTAAAHRSKLIAWLRELIVEEARNLPPPPDV